MLQIKGRGRIKSVQLVSKTLTNGVGSETSTLATAVNPGQTVLIPVGSHEQFTAKTAAYSSFCYAQITDENTVTFTHGTTVTGSPTFAFMVVEFEGLIRHVEYVTATLARVNGSATGTASLAQAVDTAKAAAWLVGEASPVNNQISSDSVDLSDGSTAEFTTKCGAAVGSAVLCAIVVEFY